MADDSFSNGIDAGGPRSSAPPPLPGFAEVYDGRPLSKESEPGSIRAIWVLAVCLGATGILSPLYVFGNPSSPSVYSDPGQRSYFVVTGILGLVTGSAQLAGGILCMKRRELGRRLLLGFAGVWLVAGSAAAFYTGRHLTGGLMRQAFNSAPNGQSMPPAFQTGFIHLLAWIFAIFGMLFVWAWCGGILYCFTRENVKKAFNTGPTNASSDSSAA